MELSHLHPSLHSIFSESDEVRINKIQQDSWIGYPKAIGILNKMEDLLQHPQTMRMPNLLIVGDTNNGKTILANRFFSSNHPFIRDEDKMYIAPVVYTQAPPKPDERRFYSGILDRLSSPHRINDRIEHLQKQVFFVLKSAETRVLVIDEIHHILAGNMAAQRSFLNVIKYLANELQIVIVAVGTKDALAALSTDPQLSNRFEPVVLPKWSMNEEYQRLLASMEYLTPIKKASQLANEDLARRILGLSEGTIGEISSIVKKSAIQAIKQGYEQITKKIIDSIDYTSPSERKRSFNSY